MVLRDDCKLIEIKTANDYNNRILNPSLHRNPEGHFFPLMPDLGDLFVLFISPSFLQDLILSAMKRTLFNNLPHHLITYLVYFIEEMIICRFYQSFVLIILNYGLLVECFLCKPQWWRNEMKGEAYQPCPTCSSIFSFA